MIRSPLRLALLAAATFAVGGGALADDRPELLAAPSAPQSESRSFVTSYLAPRMSARLGDSRAAVASEFASPQINPWTTRRDDTEDRVRRGAIRATKSAVKRYALERLNLVGWSLPLGKSREQGAAAFRTESGGARLRFGFSHRAPRAEALLPVDSGRITVSADVLGRFGTSFETPNGRFRVGAYVDPHENTATAGLTVSF